MVVNKASNNMTLEKIYNKWFPIQPLSEADQNSIVLMFLCPYGSALAANLIAYK